MTRQRLFILLIAATPCELVAARASGADYVIHISVDGLRPDSLQAVIDAGSAPNFKRFQDEGAWTNNARADFANTETLPNHTSMLTGRPVLQPVGMPNTVHHGYVDNGDPGSNVTLHNSGNLNVPYKASTLDVVHDAGHSTAMYASKTKFVLYQQSYDDKLDNFLATGNEYSMQSQFLADMAAHRYAYAFIHYNELDLAGHNAGWGSSLWRDSVASIDELLRQTFALIEADDLLRGRTAIVLSADHGGTGTEHSTASIATNYTIPFYVWGAGVAHGDLYALNSGVRTDPRGSRPDYSAANQPIRNGDGGNLALALLGLGAIPGSLINAGQDLRVARPGDFTADGHIDAADLARWSVGFGAASGAAHDEGDADGDHDVDGSDFLVWQRQYGAPAAAAGAPEPATALLAAPGLAFGMRHRRRTTRRRL